jgi:adenylate kinase
MNLIILGAPGSGKGTQAELIAQKYHLKHITGGALLRQEVESGSPKGVLIGHIMNKGGLVPFQTITSITEPVIIDHKDAFILDGSPRDIDQATYLTDFFDEEQITLRQVFYLSVPTDKLVDRLMARAKQESRGDDNLETIKARFTVFEQETLPVIEYYQSRGILTEIDGDRSIPDIASHLDSIIATYGS